MRPGGVAEVIRSEPLARCPLINLPPDYICSSSVVQVHIFASRSTAKIEDWTVIIETVVLYIRLDGSGAAKVPGVNVYEVVNAVQGYPVRRTGRPVLRRGDEVRPRNAVRDGTTRGAATEVPEVVGGIVRRVESCDVGLRRARRESKGGGIITLEIVAKLAATTLGT